MAHADALVRAALAASSGAEYAAVVSKLNDSHTSEVEVGAILESMAANIDGCLADDRRSLVSAALKVRWSRALPSANGFLGFVQELMARQTLLVESVLVSLVDAFAALPPMSLEVADAAHATLRGLLFTLPLVARPLCDVIHRHFPHKSQKKAVHLNYLRHVLRIMGYEMYVQPLLLPQIMQQLLAIDVEEASPPPAVERPDLESCGDHGVDDQEDGTVFRMDDLANKQATAGAAMYPEWEKLDALLALVLDFMQRTKDASAAEPKTTEMLMYGLLQGFDAFVLQSPQPQGVHFLLLMATSFQREHAHTFLGYLSNKLTSGGDETLAVRQSCLAFMTSFACSAAFLDTSTIHMAVDVLLRCAESLANPVVQGTDQERSAGGRWVPPGAIPQPGLLAVRGLFHQTLEATCLVFERRWKLVGNGAHAVDVDSPSLLGRLRQVMALDAHNFLERCSPRARTFVLNVLPMVAKGDDGAGSLAKQQASAPAALPLPFESCVLPEAGAYIRPLLLDRSLVNTMAVSPEQRSPSVPIAHAAVFPARASCQPGHPVPMALGSSPSACHGVTPPNARLLRPAPAAALGAMEDRSLVASAIPQQCVRAGGERAMGLAPGFVFAHNSRASFGLWLPRSRVRCKQARRWVASTSWRIRTTTVPCRSPRTTLRCAGMHRFQVCGSASGGLIPCCARTQDHLRKRFDEYRRAAAVDSCSPGSPFGGALAGVTADLGLNGRQAVRWDGTRSPLGQPRNAGGRV